MTTDRWTVPPRWKPLMRIPVPWMFVLAYLLGVALDQVIPLGGPRPGALLLGVAGAVLFIAGAALARWAWTIFHGAGTTRIPGRRSTTLVTWGPYRASRNPMYVGLTLAYVGEAGLLRQVWPVLVLPLLLAFLNWVIIPVEEARLREVF